MFTTSSYECSQCVIPSGSVLYGFSDGVYEIQEADGELWTYEGFRDMIGKLHKADSVVLSDVVQNILRIKDISSFEDDCSIVQVQF